MSHSFRPAAGFLAAALVLVPLPRQVRARNIATIAMIFWLSSFCFTLAIDATIWAGNVKNSAPLWCDISKYRSHCGIMLSVTYPLESLFFTAIKLKSGTYIALSAASLCICKHLESLSAGRPMPTTSCRSFQVAFELGMCFGLPFLWMFVCV